MPLFRTLQWTWFFVAMFFICKSSVGWFAERVVLVARLQRRS
jgi:hypothetical protein